MPKIRRTLLSVSDKTQLVPLAQALVKSGAEIIATGRTATVLSENGMKVTPIESVSGNPEAFQGRMKTLSFQVCSGILFRREDPKDEKDAKHLGVHPIDCVVVNFYPFEEVSKKEGVSSEELIEQIDIGGPTLVRAAAKNAPSVLTLTSPTQYDQVISELESEGRVTDATALRCSSQAWARVRDYDEKISQQLGPNARALRYGENPHQAAGMETFDDSPIRWNDPLTDHELSYNNVLDLTAAFECAVGLKRLGQGQQTGVVIVKHQNPCGVALVPNGKGAQLRALERAWAGDPVSSFGGVVVFTDTLEDETAAWLSERFVELVSAPNWSKHSETLQTLVKKRKRLKAVEISRFEDPRKEQVTVIPGGRLYQSIDHFEMEPLRGCTQRVWPSEKSRLAQFGILLARVLKSNALSLVIENSDGGYQLIAGGQGQPNRVDALRRLVIPRGENVLRETAQKISDCVLVSDAFFPFSDAVEVAHEAGIRYIVQPGGSIKDQEVIDTCDRLGISMVLTGKRHFRH